MFLIIGLIQLSRKIFFILVCSGAADDLLLKIQIT